MERPSVVNRSRRGKKRSGMLYSCPLGWTRVPAGSGWADTEVHMIICSTLGH